MERIIMHYDMDAFYASIEINRNPKLKNKPLVVGENIVTTASYEARKFGIHSAMKVSDAKLLCPKLIVIPVDKTEYIRISNEIHNLIFKITNKVEFVATDEGYIDLTDIIRPENKKNFAIKFKQRIKELTNLTCSVGIGFNKLSTKIASDINKPFGFFIFENEEEFIRYISDKKIKIIPGVGKKFFEILKNDKIFYVKDIFKYSLDYLVKKYGKSRGENLYCSVRGIDYDEVEYQREIHSIGNEETFLIPLQNNSEIIREFNSLFEYTFERLLKNNVFTQSITIKMRYTSFKTYTKSKKLKFSTRSKDFLYNEMLELISSFEKEDEVRLLGVYFGDIKKSSLVQLELNKNLQ
ncbi:DNA polymerase IV [Fusobacterium nucleatum]|uniref:DNA polymerase IV n=1 Tax=Fusobacterium nucleatum TaxID=851 RepID=UPI0030CF0961